MTSKDSHDPGWNDPPLFTYDKATAIQAAAATKKGISLNKRVAFPLSGSSGNKQDNVSINSSSDLAKPPPMSSLPGLPPSNFPIMKAEVVPQIEPKVVEKDRLQKVLQNFQVDAINEDEIIKRIRIMEKMWNEDKLSETVQSRLYDLSEALAKSDTETADHIQKSLMVDYVSQCSTWMSGIRHLINKKRNENS